MWVLGGGRTAPNPSNEVNIYDPVECTWTTGPPFTTARRNFPADTDGSTRIWLAGGYDGTERTSEFDGDLLRRGRDTYANAYANANANRNANPNANANTDPARQPQRHTYSQAGDAGKHFDSTTSRDR